MFAGMNNSTVTYYFLFHFSDTAGSFIAGNMKEASIAFGCFSR